jgi:hypothetical protein
LLMVSDATGKVGPCIVISVWDESLCETEEGREKTERKATKIIRKLHTMKTSPFPYKVIADTLSLSARWLSSDESKALTSRVSLGSLNTLVSMEIGIGLQGRRNFRLGGVIRVGPKLYGLTVAHPLSDHRRPSAGVTDSSQLDEEGDASDNSDFSDDAESEESLFKPNHFSFVGAIVEALETQHTLANSDTTSSPEPLPSQPDERNSSSKSVNMMNCRSCQHQLAE